MRPNEGQPVPTEEQEKAQDAAIIAMPLSRRRLFQVTGAVTTVAAADALLPKITLAQTEIPQTKQIETFMNEQIPQEVVDLFVHFRENKVMDKLLMLEEMHKQLGFETVPTIINVLSPNWLFRIEDLIDPVTNMQVSTPSTTMEMIKAINTAVRKPTMIDKGGVDFLTAPKVANFLYLPQDTKEQNKVEWLQEENGERVVNLPQANQVEISYQEKVPREVVEKINAAFNLVFNLSAHRSTQLSRIRIEIQDDFETSEVYGEASHNADQSLGEQVTIVLPNKEISDLELLGLVFHEFAHLQPSQGYEAFTADTNLVEQLNDQLCMNDLFITYFKTMRDMANAQPEDLEIYNAMRSIVEGDLNQDRYINGAYPYDQHEMFYNMIASRDIEGLEKIKKENFDTVEQLQFGKWYNHMQVSINEGANAEESLEKCKKANTAYLYLKEKFAAGETIPIDNQGVLSTLVSYHLYAHEIRSYLIQRFIVDSVTQKRNPEHIGTQNNKKIKRLVQSFLNQGRNNLNVDQLVEVVDQMTTDNTYVESSDASYKE